MKILTFVAGLFAGIMAIVVVNQVQEGWIVTVNRDHYNEIVSKCTLLEKEIKELKERVIEKDRESSHLSNLIFQKELLLKQKDEEIAKLSGKTGTGDGNEIPTSPEKVKERIEEIKARFEEAFAKKDGEKVLQSIRELIALGPDAYRLAVNLWHKAGEDHRGDNKLNLTRQQLQMAIAEVNFVKWALSDNTIDKGIRRNAIFILPYLDAKSTPSIFSSALVVEKDGELKRQLVRSLGDFKNKDGEKVLIDMLYKESDNRLRVEIIDSLSGYHSNEVTSALTAFTGSQDQYLAETAKVALIVQNSPVNGYVVTQVNRSSQAEKGGLKKGDILISYNNQSIKNGWTFGDLIKKTTEKDTVPVTVYRNGSLITFNFKGGRLGIDGRTVKSRT